MEPLGNVKSFPMRGEPFLWANFWTIYMLLTFCPHLLWEPYSINIANIANISPHPTSQNMLQEISMYTCCFKQKPKLRKKTDFFLHLCDQKYRQEGGISAGLNLSARLPPHSWVLCFYYQRKQQHFFAHLTASMLCYCFSI